MTGCFTADNGGAVKDAHSWRAHFPGYHLNVMERSIKEEAHRLVDQLPDTAGWDELMEQI